MGLVHVYNVGIVFHCTLPIEGKDAKNVTDVRKGLVAMEKMTQAIYAVFVWICA